LMWRGDLGWKIVNARRTKVMWEAMVHCHGFISDAERTLGM
jgi:hypothetical protein